MKLFFLNFASNSKTLISYGASFGLDYFEGSKKLKLKISSLLKRYSGISVREYSGVDICKRDFGINASVVLDPTQLIEANEYNKLIESENLLPPNYRYVACMIFPNEEFDNKQTHSLLNSFAGKLNLKVEYALKKNNTVAQWLNIFKNADFVFTDSYHGVMFSIVFRKQFICLINKERGANRFLTIAKELNLQDRFFFDVNDVNVEQLINTPIDYSLVEVKLSKLRCRSINFLQQSLIKNANNNKAFKDRVWHKIKFLIKKVMVGCV